MLSKTNKILIYIIVIFLLLLLVVIFPEHIVEIQVAIGKIEPTNTGLIENEYRKTMLQGIGGIAVLFGIYVAYKRMKVTELQLKNTSTQIELIQEGQINDRFSRAIELLSKKEPDVRIAALITLEGIAKERDELYEIVLRIIIAYINRRAEISQGRKNLKKLEKDIEEAFEISLRMFFSSKINKLEFYNIYLPSWSFIFNNEFDKMKTIFFENSVVENSLIDNYGLNKIIFKNSKLINNQIRSVHLLSEISFYRTHISNCFDIDPDKGEMIIRNSIIENSSIAFTKNTKINKCLISDAEIDIIQRFEGKARIRNCTFKNDCIDKKLLNKTNVIDPIKYDLDYKQWINS